MNKVRKFLANIPKPFKNKYIVTLFLFTFWIMFIDDYNIIEQYKLEKKIEDLQSQKSYYMSEIDKDSTKFYHIQNIQEEQERFAREKFLMRKDNEDIFIIREKIDE